MEYSRTRAFDLYAGQGSNVTSLVFCTADAKEITLQILGGSSSTLTLQGSNVTGPTARTAQGGAAVAEAEWSALTTIVSTGNNFVNIESGIRWMRALRTSSATRAVLGVQGPY